jgi:hypothetical protein
VTHRVRIVLVFGAVIAALAAGVAAAAQPSHSPRVPATGNPTPIPPEPVPVPPPSGPCGDANLRCPDLVVLPPSDLRVLRGRNGHVRLASRNRLINRGSGPLFLLGARETERTMRVSQRIYSQDGDHTDYPLPETRFDFWSIPGQGRYWKLRDGLRFELWTAGGPLEQFVKLGRKTRFCMRDLVEVPGLGGPRFRKFGGCNQSARTRTLRMGISVGWEESYPPGYYEQYVDVTGLSGCFSLRHVADPLGHVFESDESNNFAQTRIHLPPHRGRLRGC